MQELEEQKKTTAEINQERLSLLKNREINYNLYNMLKAVLMQLSTKEIEVDIDKLEEARNYELYVEVSYLIFAKRIILIDKKKLKVGVYMAKEQEDIKQYFERKSKNGN